ncbi:type VI secretion system PAAR protein [Photobacterium indicum]|uniref:type VI secretion system PAAR protein n=1 Tax=Photobacterium indicum TaxID=81447 RepID=UPI003D0A788C
MGNAVKVGDIGTDHDGFPPTAITAGSNTVKVDGIPAARKGDPLDAHNKPKHPLHPRTITGGSSSVFIDGKSAARSGDAVDCGGVLLGGGTINIG